MRKLDRLALVTAGLSVPLTLAALCLSIAAVYFFQPQVYQQALAEQHIDQRFSGLAAQQLVFYFHSEGVYLKNIVEIQPAPAGSHHIEDLLPLLGRLSQSDWESILTDLAPPEWIRQQLDGIIEQAIGNIVRAEDSPQILVSTNAVKGHLLSDAGMQAFLRLVRAQRPCKPEGVSAYIGRQELTLPTCRPPDDEIAALEPQFRWALRGITDAIPNPYNVAESLTSVLPQPVSLADEPGPGAASPVRRMGWVRRAALFSPVVPLALLLVTGLLAGRSTYTRLRWWGTSLLVAGLVGLVLAAGLQPALGRLVAEHTLRGASPYFTPDLVRLLVSATHAIVVPFGRWLALGTLGLATAGVVLLGASTWKNADIAG